MQSRVYIIRPAHAVQTPGPMWCFHGWDRARPLRMMDLYSLLLAHRSPSRARSTGTGCVISLLREFATQNPIGEEEVLRSRSRAWSRNASTLTIHG